MAARALLRTASALCVLGLAAAGTQAASWTSFEPAAYEAARKAEKIVLLQFGERGCVACEEQERVLSRLFWSSSRNDWAGFEVNLARNAEFAKGLGVHSLSTLVLMRGSREVARTVGVIQESELLAFLRQADSPEPRGRAPSRPRNRRPPRP